jgi:hypothetical protein
MLSPRCWIVPICAGDPGLVQRRINEREIGFRRLDAEKNLCSAIKLGSFGNFGSDSRFFSHQMTAGRSLPA